MPKTILVADDEKTVREVVAKYLEKNGYRVVQAERGPQVIDLFYEHAPDLIVLDVMLPGLDGFTIIRSLRDPIEVPPMGVNPNVPIIMLTARTGEDDRIVGFELGADDYVTKPFSPQELVMRVKAVLRRSASDENAALQTESPLTFDALMIDPNSRTVVNGAENITLTAKEFDLLWFMARHPRQVFTRSQLLDQVWGYGFYGDESTVTVHMHRLREKLETDPNQPQFIHTVWGVGYKFEYL